MSSRGKSGLSKRIRVISPKEVVSNDERSLAFVDFLVKMKARILPQISKPFGIRVAVVPDTLVIARHIRRFMYEVLEDPA